MNLNSFLKKSNIDVALESVVLTLADSVKIIAQNIKDCGIGEAGGDENVSGDKQMALDVLANDLLSDELKENMHVHSFASEEEKVERKLNNNGKYAVALDPLDGSSLINTNLAVGTIFGVYESQSFIGLYGRDQVCAAYAVYGPRTTFVITFGKGVYGFGLTLNGDFVMNLNNPRIQDDSKIFSPGNLRAVKENPKYLKIMNDWMKEQKTLRYSGGMVPDINQIFCKQNGIFSYPGYSKYPNGKLRILYECAPFSFLMEAAGGVSFNQNGKRILDIEITDLHQRSTIFIGSKNEVSRCISELA